LVDSVVKIYFLLYDKIFIGKRQSTQFLYAYFLYAYEIPSSLDILVMDSLFGGSILLRSASFNSGL
ncbi:hypothetical protein ACTNEY_13110, partial [Fusicatenibacter saccharivorans]|uniref:hypothetical protein n=1 Tax=Fusicatenibacter saccharivorans TaxID=1150298 RepID=UPI003F8AF6BB